MCNSSPLNPWHRLAAKVGPSEVGEGLGDSPLKMFVAFLGEENISFGCSISLTIPTIGVIVLWLCVKKYLNLIKHKPHPDCQLAFGFNSNFPTSILVSFS